MTERSISLGIAGLGVAGSFMLRALDLDQRFRVAACAEPLELPRHSFCAHYSAKGYSVFDDLCADPAIEAIYVATPHQFHLEQAVLALEAGKHVVVEKPMALTVADCDRIVAAARNARRHVVVGHSHAFDPNVQAVGDLVRSGIYGRLGMIHTFNYNDFLFRPHRADEFDPKSGGGIVFNQVAHQVEIIRRIAGEPVVRVRAHLGDLVGVRHAHGHCSALIQFASGASASLVYSSYGHFDSDEWHHNIAEGGAAIFRSTKRCCRTSFGKKSKACPEAADCRCVSEDLASEHPQSLPGTSSGSIDLSLPFQTDRAGPAPQAHS